MICVSSSSWKDQHVRDRHIGKGGGGDHRGKMLVVTIVMILVASQFYQLWKLGEKNTNAGRDEEDMMIMQKKKNSTISRAELRVFIQSLTKEDKQALLRDILEDDPHMVVTTNQHHVTREELQMSNNSNNISSTDNMISAFGSLTAEEREAIINTVNGKEYPYRLTCPNYEDTADILTAAPGNASRSVIVGYHIGMLKNWRVVVKDQLNTLFQCGLGSVLDHMFISYSNNSTVDDELQELKSILNQFSFARDATVLYNEFQPIEGLAINLLHEDCTKRNASSSPHSDTVAFYFHTKGTSRFTSDWESRMDMPWEYTHVMYWRKYMEYFTIERPYLCMKQILDNGKFTCGTHAYHLGFYGGNFWAASCRYLSSLDPLNFFPANDTMRRYDAEQNFVKFPRNNENDKFISIDETPVSFYEQLLPPRNYSDYSQKWHGALNKTVEL